ncbi:pseudouridine-5'-phosphate glycosidase [Kosmotoga pacifica]|uniref:Pseudouridine-5'-phosphate glycosidase n=1 Tax=Kosmotoga pacifica TaxID=1330330 RepID=A0A0G2ZE41_9BACT|nr:pseudouridine-5'-phosphate glycosidase [Kosmotoga pacifica]AKI97078.1 pseudouridine-5'-phosphate glycosidase [Kosmotoga pacifica]
MDKAYVALESTVIAHGLPWPANFETAVAMEEEVKKNGSVPRTIGIIGGEIKIGITRDEIKYLSTAKNVMKVGTAEIAVAVALKKDAATTVSATMKLAAREGIEVFATGGIGGVHKGVEWDVSQDIVELSKTNMIVVSAGVKSILDVEKTLEFLETFQVTVVGYRTDRFPLFHTRFSKFPVNITVNTPEEIAAIFEEKKRLGIEGAILVANPIPTEYEIPHYELMKYIETAITEATSKNISGKSLTPFLLNRLGELSDGKTLEANIALLKNNAALAGQIAKVLKEL